MFIVCGARRQLIAVRQRERERAKLTLTISFFPVLIFHNSIIAMANKQNEKRKTIHNERAVS